MKSMNDSIHKYNLKNKAMSIIELQYFVSSLDLNIWRNIWDIDHLQMIQESLICSLKKERIHLHK